MYKNILHRQERIRKRLRLRDHVVKKGLRNQKLDYQLAGDKHPEGTQDAQETHQEKIEEIHRQPQHERNQNHPWGRTGDRA